MVVPNKLGKVHICVDYRKLNGATIYHFPFPFVNILLDDIVGNEMYNFLDGFLGHNEISIHYRVGSICIYGDDFWFEKWAPIIF